VATPDAEAARTLADSATTASSSSTADAMDTFRFLSGSRSFTACSFAAAALARAAAAVATAVLRSAEKLIITSIAFFVFFFEAGGAAKVLGTFLERTGKFSSRSSAATISAAALVISEDCAREAAADCA
jgi:hypothetical protein